MVGVNSQSGGPAEPRVHTWGRRFLSGLKAQPGKSAVVGVLAFVLIILLTRLAGQSGPRPAAAAVDLVVQPRNVSLDSGIVPAIAVQQTTETEPVVLVPEPERPRFRAPQRDIFAVDYGYFPRRPGSESDNTVEGVDSKQLRIADLRRRVGTFRLQSTVTGAEPAAIIDGKIVRRKDVYKGFRVVKVDNRHVLLKHSGHVFRLNMERE